MKTVIKAFLVVTLLVILVLVIAISFVRYELSKDHEKSKLALKMLTLKTSFSTFVMRISVSINTQPKTVRKDLCLAFIGI